MIRKEKIAVEFAHARRGENTPKGKKKRGASTFLRFPWRELKKLETTAEN